MATQTEASTGDTGGGPITLDHWIALNDEMLALVRSGVPLDSGLIRAGSEIHGAVGGLAGRIGAQMERGQSLDQALEAEASQLPELYRAVVRAGVRSGRLAQALEGMATFARGVAQTRHAIGVALFYPFVVFTLAYVLFVAFVMVVFPRFLDAFTVFRLDPPVAVRIMTVLHEHAVLWIPLVPAVLLVLGLGWVLSNRASSVHASRLYGLLRLVPGLGAIIADAQSATLADVMALLLEHGSSLPEAIRLAADASGDPKTIAEGAEMAAAIERGQTPTVAPSDRKAAFPPLLRWILVTNAQRGEMAVAVRHAGNTYRSRAIRRAESVEALLPVTLLLVIGGLAVILFALTVFAPLASFWYELSVPPAPIS